MLKAVCHLSQPQTAGLRGDCEISSESNLDRDLSLIFLLDTYDIYVLAVLELQSLMYTMSYKP